MPQIKDPKAKNVPAPVADPPSKDKARPELRQAGSLAAQEALLKPKDGPAPAASGDKASQGEVAVFILQHMQRGMNAAAAGRLVPAEHRGELRVVLEAIKAREVEVRRWLTLGATRTLNGAEEHVKPCPPEVIAGWLGFLPADPSYSPAPTSAFPPSHDPAGKEDDKPAATAAGRHGGTGSRGEIAMALISQMQHGVDVMRAVSSMPPEHRVVATQVAKIIQQHELAVRLWFRKGCETDAGERVKPPPAHAIAGELGFLPKDPRFKFTRA